MTRDFSTISPSAKAILLVRAQTSLPYARAAATIMFGDEAVARGADDRRRIHFEERARSVDTALASIEAKSVLELAGGLSFRGLAMVESANIHYVDTDLEEMVAIKRSLLPRLSTKPRLGTLSVEELNALDRDAWTKLVSEIPDGPITIVNEGLLMYLDDVEKRRLVANIHEVLRTRGGHWITADIYVRTADTIFRDEKSKAFAAAHGIDEKKFATFEDAEKFFIEAGFVIKTRLNARSRETWTLAVELPIP